MAPDFNPGEKKEESMKIKHIVLIILVLTIAVSCGRKGGVLEIQSDRESADVYLDETLIGQTPLMLEEVESGKHVLKIQKKEDGHIYEYQEVFTMPKKEDINIDAILTRLLTKEEINDILIEVAQTHPQPVKEDDRAVIETPYGRIVIQFFPEEAPVHLSLIHI